MEHDNEGGRSRFHECVKLHGRIISRIIPFVGLSSAALGWHFNDKRRLLFVVLFFLSCFLVLAEILYKIWDFSRRGSSTFSERVPLLAAGTTEAINIHDSLRTKIKTSMTVQDCIDVYDSNAYQQCLDVLRRSVGVFRESSPGCCDRLLRVLHQPFESLPNEDTSQDGVYVVDDWAKYWVEAKMSSDAKYKKCAHALDDCRKTCFLLLKRVCDLWNYLGDETKPEDERLIEKFDKRRVNQIMIHTLVMDRANSLYFMSPDLTAQNVERGLCWYSDYDDKARKIIEMPKNPDSSSINKRYIWLYYKFYSEKDVAMHYKVASDCFSSATTRADSSGTKQAGTGP